MTIRLAIAVSAGSLMVGASLAASPEPNRAMVGVPEPQRARINWILKCQGCHRADGTGTSATAPALAGQVSRFTSLSGGRAYLGRVPGVADAALGDAELAELLNWTLQHFDRANLQSDFKPYTAREINTLRRSPLRTDATAARTAILSQASATR
ncbi:c-type cytochrome [Novosphingobium aquae]|uniref:C-type cytochrome n=1 Tax=Novosphingobium aquae TaxID=3133435 RepID=A0ABU8S5Y6_9SPHN